MDGALQGYEALRARIARLGHMDRRVLNMLRLQAEREAKARVRRRTGNLGRTIGSEMQSDTTARLYARANYAADVEFDTKPHDISPVVKKALAFASQGIVSERFGSSAVLKLNLTGRMSAKSANRFGNAALAVVKKVHHPGTKAQPFLRPGAKAAIEGAGLAKEIIAIWDGKP